MNAEERKRIGLALTDALYAGPTPVLTAGDPLEVRIALLNVLDVELRGKLKSSPATTLEIGVGYLERIEDHLSAMRRQLLAHLDGVGAYLAKPHGGVPLKDLLAGADLAKPGTFERRRKEWARAGGFALPSACPWCGATNGLTVIGGKFDQFLESATATFCCDSCRQSAAIAWVNTESFGFGDPRPAPAPTALDAAIDREREEKAKLAAARSLVKCGRCDGCGKISDNPSGEPWTRWESLPPGSDAAVRAGIVKPIPCPECGGSGVYKDPTERGT